MTKTCQKIHRIVKSVIDNLEKINEIVSIKGLESPDMCTAVATVLISTSLDIIHVMQQTAENLRKEHPDNNDISRLYADLQVMMLSIKSSERKLPLTSTNNPDRKCGIGNTVQSLRNVDKWLSSIDGSHDCNPTICLDIMKQLLLNIPIRDCWTIYRQIVPVIDQVDSRINSAYISIARNDVQYKHPISKSRQKIKTSMRFHEI